MFVQDDEGWLEMMDDEVWPVDDGTDWKAVRAAIREANQQEKEQRQQGSSSSSKNPPPSVYRGATSKASSDGNPHEPSKGSGAALEPSKGKGQGSRASPEPPKGKGKGSAAPPEPSKGKGKGLGHSIQSSSSGRASTSSGTNPPKGSGRSGPSTSSSSKRPGGKTSGSSGCKRPPWKKERFEDEDGDYDEDEDAHEDDERPKKKPNKGKGKGKEWSSPGFPSKTRRMLARMRQEMLNHARHVAGLPVSGQSLSRQIHWEQTHAWTVQTRQECMARAMAEAAVAAQQAGHPSHLIPGHDIPSPGKGLPNGSGKGKGIQPLVPDVGHGKGIPPLVPDVVPGKGKGNSTPEVPGKGYPIGGPVGKGPVPLTPGNNPAASVKGFLTQGKSSSPPLQLHAIDPKLPPGPVLI
jgi:hypothetical protein